jgi:hypothetical protein
VPVSSNFNHQDITTSHDLSGTWLISLLKDYQQSPTVVQAASGIICYPLLGLVALVGVVSNYVESFFLDNDGIISSIESIRAGVKYAAEFRRVSESTENRHKHIHLPVKEIDIAKQGVDTACDALIKEIRSSYCKLSLKTSGAVYGNYGKIKATLLTTVPKT